MLHVINGLLTKLKTDLRRIVETVISLIYRLAFSIIPQDVKEWIVEMKDESAFITGYASRLRWATSALEAAVKIRADATHSTEELIRFYTRLTSRLLKRQFDGKKPSHYVKS